MKNLQFTVDSAKCIDCGACIADCPAEVIYKRKGLPSVPEKFSDGCIECQHCLAVCPTGALSVFGLKPEDSPIPDARRLPSPEAAETFLHYRRSVRQYKKEDLPAELLDEMLEELSNSPTGCNARALDLILIDKQEILNRKLEEVISIMEETAAGMEAPPELLVEMPKAYRRYGKDQLFRGAPHLLLAAARPNAVCAETDCVIALAEFELLAVSRGLGTVWCGYLPMLAKQLPQIRPLFGLEPDQPFYAMLFGRPAVRYARSVQRRGAASIRKLK